MAGSYNHVVEKPSGKLLMDEDICGMLECYSGDVAEAVEEMYGMIWFLAHLVQENVGGATAAEYVEEARQGYEKGLKWSPGRTDKRLPVED